jgi:tripartite motif-containing protein 2/3
VLCFSLEGEFLVGFGTYGQGGNQFGLPAGLAFDGEGRLWVVDSANGRLMRFSFAAVAEGLSFLAP